LTYINTIECTWTGELRVYRVRWSIKPWSR
jgi:hypothetical protein